MWICARSSRSGHVACRGSSEASCRFAGPKGAGRAQYSRVDPRLALVRPREPSPPSSTLWLTPLPTIAAARQGGWTRSTPSSALPSSPWSSSSGPERSVQSVRRPGRRSPSGRFSSAALDPDRRAPLPRRWRSHPDPDPAGRSRGGSSWARASATRPPRRLRRPRDAVRYFRAGVDLAEQSGAGDQVLGRSRAPASSRS